MRRWWHKSVRKIVKWNKTKKKEIASCEQNESNMSWLYYTKAKAYDKYCCKSVFLSVFSYLKETIVLNTSVPDAKQFCVVSVLFSFFLVAIFQHWFAIGKLLWSGTTCVVAEKFKRWWEKLTLFNYFIKWWIRTL